MYTYVYFLPMALQPNGPSSFIRFLDYTQRHTTVGSPPLDEWSARRRDLYLTIHNNHNRRISIPPAGFEPTMSAGEQPQTYALDRVATGTGVYTCVKCTRVQALRLCTGRTAHRGSTGIALPFYDHDTRRGWGVSVTPRPLFTPRERPSTHSTLGWMGPRADLDRCRKSRSHRRSILGPSSP